MRSLKQTLKVLVLVVAVFALGFLSGCGTLYGVSSDIEEGSRAIRKLMEPSQKGLEQTRIERAADLVLRQRGYGYSQQSEVQQPSQGTGDTPDNSQH